MSAAGPWPRAAARATPLTVPYRAAVLGAVLGVTALAAALRLSAFANVQPNPFYDAAVRSMAQSWHNFVYGAFEPGGALSVDKPPVDLWLQVASVKLFGFSSAALRLPEALAGTLAVPLLYDTVRRLCGNAAGLAAAAALAVLPVSVLTARSDTMDSVLMALMVLAAWLTVRAAEGGRRWPLIAAGATVGLAFNVKLFEAFLVLPALALLYVLAASEPLRPRLARLLGAGGVALAVSLAWIVAVSAAPGAKPFPIGSTDGTVWNVVFKFNGTDRLGTGHASSPLPAPAPAHASHRVRPARQAVATNGPTRLFARGKNRYGPLIGAELAAALLLGGLAVAVGLARRPSTPDERAARRRRVAAAAAVGVWLLLGAALFSQVTRLHARYLEAMTAAVAAALGIGLASLATAAPRSRLAAGALAVGTSAAAAISVRLSGAGGSAGTVSTLAAVTVTAGCAVLLLPRMEAIRGRAMGASLTAVALVAVLAPPVVVARDLVRAGASDSGRPGFVPPQQVQALSSFLSQHAGGSRYELVSASAAPAGPLIVRDGRPVLILTTIDGRAVVSQRQIARAVRSGQVRYAMLPRGRCTSRFAGKTRCVPAVRWARRHAVDVSAQAHLGRRGSLYELSPHVVKGR